MGFSHISMQTLETIKKIVVTTDKNVKKLNIVDVCDCRISWENKKHNETFKNHNYTNMLDG